MRVNKKKRRIEKKSIYESNEQGQRIPERREEMRASKFCTSEENRGQKDV